MAKSVTCSYTTGLSSPASDLWALGVCLYVIITGTFPFHAALFDCSVTTSDIFGLFCLTN